MLNKLEADIGFMLLMLHLLLEADFPHLIHTAIEFICQQGSLCPLIATHESNQDIIQQTLCDIVQICGQPMSNASLEQEQISGYFR